MQDQLAGRHRHERLGDHQPVDAPPDPHLHRVANGQPGPCQLVGPQVQDEVAEVVDRRPSTRAPARSSRTSPAGSTSGPSFPGSTPEARCAAAGANTSRPWKVRDTVASR